MLPPQLRPELRFKFIGGYAVSSARAGSNFDSADRESDPPEGTLSLLVKWHIARCVRSLACVRISSIRSARMNTHRRPILDSGTLLALAFRSKQSSLMCKSCAACVDQGSP